MNENRVKEEILRRYSKKLKALVKKYNLSGSTEQSHQLEALSRYLTEQAMKKINADVEVHHHPQYDTFDAEFLSGRTIQLETKVRYVSSTTYPTCDVSAAKIDALKEADGWLMAIYWLDGVYEIFDVNECTPTEGWWTKYHYTVSDQQRNWKEKERCYKFDPQQAKFKGKL